MFSFSVKLPTLLRNCHIYLQLLIFSNVIYVAYKDLPFHQTRTVYVEIKRVKWFTEVCGVKQPNTADPINE